MIVLIGSAAYTRVKQLEMNRKHNSTIDEESAKSKI
jgi:hypothetical protein